MSISLQTNVSALRAQNSLATSHTSLATSLQRLSSGYRINSAADDAAGMGISENLRADIRSLQQSVRNASDGMSVVNVAEGAMAEVGNILIRMRELSEQSSTGTLGDDERGYLDSEFQQLVLEITRIAESTEFNGTHLLDGTNASLEIQVGIGTMSDSQVVLNLGSGMTADNLGLNGINITTANDALSTMTAIINATGLVSAQRADFGSAQNRLESTIRNIAMSVENLSAANSRIRDVDVALETSSMTSMQILQQAGVAVLAQANATPPLALQLLQR